MRALAALALACSGCASIPEFSHNAVLTPAEQAGLGAVAVAELLGTSQLSEDPQQNAVTASVGARLAEASGRDDIVWNFKVVRHARPIAVALPDGTVFITDALLARCRTEGELAAALAKEMGCMLAGLFPREMTSTGPSLDYVPLDIGHLTPADQSATKAEDVQAADSIGLSLLVRAGYDPALGEEVWLAGSPPIGPVGRPDYVAHRRRGAAREQSFVRSLSQARSVYQSHTAKIGAGSALAFTASQPTPLRAPTVPQAAPSQLAAGVAPTATPVAAPAAFVAAPRKTAAKAGGATDGRNVAEFSSDGDFLPPAVHSDRPGDGRWSSVADDAGADDAAQSQAIQQTSFDEFAAPAGPALP